MGVALVYDHTGADLLALRQKAAEIAATIQIHAKE
jgi:hypothetical protein